MEFIPGYNYSVGVGYIALPVDLDRDKYIGLCYKTNTVSIRCEDGAYYNRVPISSMDLNFIDFPKKTEDLGTSILYANEPIKNQLFIIRLIEDVTKIGDKTENQFKWTRKWGDSFVEISGSGKDRYISINIDSGDKGGGSFILSVKNKNKKGNKILLETDGKFETTSVDQLLLQSFTSLLLQSLEGKDVKSLFKIDNTESFFDGPKFRINKGDEAMLRGNKSIKFLEKLIDTIIQITTTTAIGQMPIMNSSSFIELKKELEGLLSEKSFLE